MIIKKIVIICISVTITCNIANAMQEEMERSAAATLSGSTRPARIVREPVSEDKVLEDVKAFLAALKMSNLQRETSYVERWRYGFNGEVIPICKRNGGTVKLVDKSCIIAGAQPSMLYGLWYADTHVPATRLFIELEDKRKLEALIKQKTSNSLRYGYEFVTHVRACCLVDDKPASINKVAIAWDFMPGDLPNKKSYITMVRVQDMIQQNAQIDLDENKVEVSSERSPEEV